MRIDTNLLLIALGLCLFGILYNQAVSYVQRFTPHYTAFFVVGGVSVTLLAATPLVGLQNAVTLFMLFAASGLPMVVGSVWRHVRRHALQEVVCESQNWRLYME